MVKYTLLVVQFFGRHICAPKREPQKTDILISHEPIRVVGKSRTVSKNLYKLKIHSDNNHNHLNHISKYFGLQVER